MGGIYLALFNLRFAKPIDYLEGRVANLGGPVDDRSGVWTFEAWDAHGSEIDASDLGLHMSTHLNLPFSYVSAAAAHGFIELPALSIKRPISRLKIDYVPVFTKTPLSLNQAGALLYICVRPEGHLQSGGIHLAWPSINETAQSRNGAHA